MNINRMASILAGLVAAGLVVVIPGTARSQLLTSQAQPQGDVLKEAQELHEQVTQLYQQGKYAQALPLALQVLAIREKALGSEHPDVAKSLNNLAVLYQTQGNYGAAEPLLIRALAIFEKALGFEHPDVASSLNNLAGLYQTQGNYGAAEPLLKQALTISEKALGSEHPDVAQSLNNLAELYKAQGNYGAAEPLLKQALTIREKVLGSEHPDVASSLNNLAVLYQIQGNYGAVEPFLKRALAIREKVLGSEHPDVAQSLNNLAKIYDYQRNYAAAEPLYKRSLAIFEKALGSEHPDFAASLNNLAGLYQDQGNYAAAESLYKRALAIREKALGSEHPDIAQSLNDLAILYKNQGNYAAAESLYKRALAIREKALKSEHPDIAQSLDNLAELYLTQGDYAAAEPLHKKALAIREKALGSEHPDVATSLNNLAELYDAQGNYAAAEPLLKRSLEISEKALGSDHPNVATILNNLAEVYYAQGNYAATEPLLKRSLEISEKALGSDHPNVAPILNSLALLYQDHGNYAAAETLFKRDLEILEKALGSDHPNVAPILNNLAGLYQTQGNYAAAEPLYKRALEIFGKALGSKYPTVAQPLNNLALLYQAKGNYALSLRYSQQGLQVEEQNLTLNLTGGSEHQKQLYLKAFSGTQYAAISLHLQTLSKNSVAARLALTTILQRKGRILDLLSNNQQLLRQNLKSEDQTLFQNLSGAYHQLNTLTFNRPEKLSSQQYKAMVEKLDDQIQSLQDQLSRRSAEFRAQIQPVTLEAVQKLIPVNTALVEFVAYQPFDPKAPAGKGFGKTRYAAYILQSQGDPQGIDLGDANTIDKAINDFRDNLQDKATGTEQLKSSARTLDALVMEPIRTHLGSIQNLLLSPDSALNLIPFEALVDKTNHYLVETNTFTYLTSGRDLLRLQTSFDSKQPPLLLGDPYFERSPEQIALKTPQIPPTRSGDIFSTVWPEIPGTETEIKAVTAQLKTLYPGTQSLIGSRATKGVVEQAQKPIILHIATHGFFGSSSKEASQTALTNNNPLLSSGLLLAGFKLKQPNPVDNGILTALEVTGVNLLGTQLVVLSACNTGAGQISAGEGVYGLRRAFVIAGSESQLISLWRIDDGFTPKLMEAYYKKLLAGSGRTNALHQTQLEFMQSKDYSHPYYWASFIPSGNWTPLKTGTPNKGSSQ